MKKEKIRYWNIEPILTKNAHYNVVYGERSNGKTYGTLVKCLEDYFKYGAEFAYLRRWDADLIGKKGESLFNAIVKNGVIRKLSKGKWNDVVYEKRSYYFAFVDDDGERTVDVRPFAYAFALTQHEHYKSNSYPMIRNIVFDEFLTRGAYLPDEFVIFQNVLSTIIRLRDDVKIFMLGNTVNKYNPYISEMGLTKMRNQKKGTIDVYDYADTGLRIAVEYSDMPVQDKKSNVYFAFDNPRLQMIRNGSWEIDIYPHYPRDEYEGIEPLKDIQYTFYVQFEGATLQCDVIHKKTDRQGKEKPATFLFVHPKTTPIKEKGTSLVYSQHTKADPRYRRRLTKPMTPLEKRLARFFAKEKVFYSDNETGEVMRNYLIWSNS